MALTYGDRLLAEAEARSRRALVRRRMLTLAAPALLATAASTRALYQDQHRWILNHGASSFRHTVTHVALLMFTGVLVALPLIGAVRAKRALPAALAFLAGPVLTPTLFGPGAWRWYQSLVVGAVCALIMLAAPRRAARYAR